MILCFLTSLSHPHHRLRPRRALLFASALQFIKNESSDNPKASLAPGPGQPAACCLLEVLWGLLSGSPLKNEIKPYSTVLNQLLTLPDPPPPHVIYSRDR